ncbi:MAG: hypothetical protein CMK07_00835 [Ponticaulis sp.]|nr:hypothetical protein [Ponticaulis sp.]
MGQVNRISKSGLELIKGFEGLRRRSEPLAGGAWIVGYGHTRSAREGVEVTEREAEYLLRYDLQETEKWVSDAIHAPLNQNEFDALVSFAWNVGRENFHASDVLKYVNAGEMLAAAESFNAWRKARVDGRLIVVDALVRRRAAEKHLFLSHPAGAPSAPSQIIRPELDVAASVLALSDGALSIETKITGDGEVQKTVTAERPLEAANSNEGLVEPENIILPGLLSDQETVEDEVETVEDTAVETEESETETTVEDAAPQPLADFDDDDDDQEEDLRPVQASIWDASDESEYADLDEYEEDEDDDFDVDDSLLAAAITASNLTRVEDETEDETETEVDAESDDVETSDTDAETAVEEAEDVDVSQAEDLPEIETTDAETAIEADEDETGSDAAEIGPELEPIDVAEPLALVSETEETVEEAIAETAEAGVVQAEEVLNEIDEDASAEDVDAEPVTTFAETVGTAEDVETVEVPEEAENVIVVEADDVVEAVEASEAEDEAETAEEEITSEVETEAEQAGEEIEGSEAVEPEPIYEEDFSPAASPATLVSSEAVQDDEEIAEIWKSDETPEATESAAGTKKKCIVDPLVEDHFPEEMAAQKADSEGYNPVMGERVSPAKRLISVLPFVILVLLGGAMCIFGATDWWGLIKSDTPVERNQLYAGPFFTIIGGVGFLFGAYFAVRNLFVSQD